MSIASQVTVKRQGEELAGSTLKHHFLYQHVILKAHERVMTSKFEAERSKRKNRGKKGGKKHVRKTVTLPLLREKSSSGKCQFIGHGFTQRKTPFLDFAKEDG